MREFELYFERLQKAGLGSVKRPDLLIFRKKDEAAVTDTVRSLGGKEELPFTPEDDPRMQTLLSTTFLAVECENSLWRATKMPGYRSQLTPQRRMGGKPGLKKNTVVPTIIVKEEDRRPLKEWQEKHEIPIHVWHVFYDMALGIALARVEELIEAGLIEPTEQVFQAPGGATTKKTIYKIYYHYAYNLGIAASEPTLVADYIDDKNGHILPYVKFQGGVLRINQQAVQLLDEASR